MSFSLIFFISFVSADEQVVHVEADVSGSFVGWIYSDGVKEKVVGSIISLATVLAGIGIYYLLKIL